MVSIQDVDSSLTTTMIFHNARSVHLHIDDIRSDYNVQKADVNIFVETRLCSSNSDDMYNISGFNIYRNDYNQSHTRSCYGSVVYLKNGFHCTELQLPKGAFNHISTWRKNISAALRCEAVLIRWSLLFGSYLGEIQATWGTQDTRISAAALPGHSFHCRQTGSTNKTAAWHEILFINCNWLEDTRPTFMQSIVIQWINAHLNNK